MIVTDEISPWYPMSVCLFEFQTVRGHPLDIGWQSEAVRRSGRQPKLSAAHHCLETAKDDLGLTMNKLCTAGSED